MREQVRGAGRTSTSTPGRSHWRVSGWSTAARNASARKGARSKGPSARACRTTRSPSQATSRGRLRMTASATMFSSDAFELGERAGGTHRAPRASRAPQDAAPLPVSRPARRRRAAPRRAQCRDRARASSLREQAAPGPAEAHVSSRGRAWHRERGSCEVRDGQTGESRSKREEARLTGRGAVGDAAR